MEELKNLVAYIAHSLVEDPDTVEIEARRHGQVVVVRIIVPPDEMGKVIGRQGRVARAMRTLLTIAASRRGLRASLDIQEAHA